MSDFPTSADVVIIGGGVMGASTAYHLALMGGGNIILLEKGPFFGLGATGKCAGGIRYQFSTEINVRLSQLSLPMLANFEEETGQAIDLRWCGYLFLLTRDRDVETFGHNVAMQNKLGVPTEWLTSQEVNQRVPSLRTDDVLAATFHACDGLADPAGVVNGYIKASRRLGVQALTDMPVLDVVIESDRIKSVVTPAGDIETSVLVNAAGPWSGAVSKLVGPSLPVIPVRRQMLVTTPVPNMQPDFPFIIDFAQSLYFHLEGDGILTGMSNPDQEPGFDESVDLEWEQIHMNAAIERLPPLEKAGRLSAWAGLYEVTPDAHPIISSVPGVDGYYAITGFSGHGFMHGPAAGLLLAEMILEGQAKSLDITKFDYRRFHQDQLIDEYNVI